MRQPSKCIKTAILFVYWTMYQNLGYPMVLSFSESEEEISTLSPLLHLPLPRPSFSSSRLVLLLPRPPGLHPAAAQWLLPTSCRQQPRPTKKRQFYILQAHFIKFMWPNCELVKN